MSHTTIPRRLVDLPDELLSSILAHLAPEDVARVAGTSRRFKRLADEPLLWRHFCRTEFRLWKPSHRVQRKLAGPVSNEDWKSLYEQRRATNRQVRDLLQEIIDSSVGRHDKISYVAQAGYDAKEELLRQTRCGDDAEDVLARRFWAGAILQSINRAVALEQWTAMRTGTDVPLEAALGAYDMFVQRTGEEDLSTISDDLDRLAKELREEQPGYHRLSTRERALRLVRFMRERGFTGVEEDRYYDLPNSFIGTVLRSPEHNSLPLLSVAIYCALGRRVGLDARLCGYPFHVYGMAFAPSGVSLDGKPVAPGRTPEHMFVDPFRTDVEVPESELREKLREIGTHSSAHNAYLSPCDQQEMVLRTARNIVKSVQIARQRTPSQVYDIDLDDAFYSALCAMILLGPQPEGGHSAAFASRRRQYLPYLIEHFQQHHPWELNLISDHIIPLFHDSERDYAQLKRLERTMVQEDLTPPEPIRRVPTCEDRVLFKVGQIFRHERYSYEGVITGWDDRCAAEEIWIRTMNVDSLPQGRNQSFYHVLVSDKTIRYVAQENIRPVRGPPSPALLRLAGRYFRRWDAERGLFVSNVREQYPDD